MVTRSQVLRLGIHLGFGWPHSHESIANEFSKNRICCYVLRPDTIRMRRL